MPSFKPNVSVKEATHVETKDGKIEKIAYKYGIDEQGRLAKPSEGGFGVITVNGRKVSMWDAVAYFREEEQEEP